MTIDSMLKYGRREVGGYVPRYNGGNCEFTDEIRRGVFYVVMVVSRVEYRCKQKLEELGLFCVCPAFEYQLRKRFAEEMVVTSRKPILEGYLFVSAEEQLDFSVLKLRCREILKVVRGGNGEPAIVRGEDLSGVFGAGDELRKFEEVRFLNRERAMGRAPKRPKGLVDGDVIRVKFGEVGIVGTYLGADMMEVKLGRTVLKVRVKNTEIELVHKRVRMVGIV
jgi:transcription antitermination factor NusG